jgi:uncharacterized protein (DUF58 family)
VLSSEETQTLDRLAFVAPPTVALPAASGLRRARLRGAGLEFHEYRHYQPGDDPRSIDWTVEARLRQLVVRVARADGHLSLHTLIDVSRSMNTGTPSKLACAAKIAAALSYVSIERRDQAAVSSFTHEVVDHVPPATGRPQLFRIFKTLEAQRASGRSGIDEALVSYGSAIRGPGIVVVLSDFFDAHSDLRGLRFLLHRRLLPAVVQVVSTEELHPAFADGTEIIDIEDESVPGLVADAATRSAYEARMAEHSAALRAFCLQHGLPWVRITSNASFGQMLSSIEAAGLLSSY